MRPAYALMLGGALFKKKVKEDGHDGSDSKSREKAIREKVVDDLRGREDSLREREAALASREEEHGKKNAELALRLQELAVRERELKAKYSEGGVPAKAEGHPSLPADSDHVDEQEKLVKVLEHRLAGARAKHEELRRATGARGRHADTIAAYRSSGYVVARLEKLEGLAASELEKALGLFEKDSAALAPLAARCDALDRAVAKEADALRARCNDPDAIPEIEQGIRELEARVEGRRAQLRKRVERWKDEGFSVARFDKLPNAGLDAMEDATTKFEEDLEVLRLFTEKLDALDATARKGAARLAPLLKDPDNIPALEKEFLALEREAGIRRQEFLELLEKWQAEGFRTEPLEKVLSADFPTMRAAFLKFDEDVHRLKSLADRASKLDVSFATQVAALNRDLHDPEQLHKLEHTVRNLEEEAEKKKATSPKRPHVPPPKVVSAAGAQPAPGPKAPAADKEPVHAPRHKAPAVETAPPAPVPEPKPATAETPVKPHVAPASAPRTTEAAPAPAGGPEAELAAEIAASEGLIKELEAKNIDPSAASNLLKLAKSFNRSKNLAKALVYAKKAHDTAAAMKK